MRAKTAKAMILIVVCCCCLLILQRNVIATNFSILPGDKYDSVLVTAILEHWYKVFTDGADWTDASYFYPYTKTIAQTDAMFLNGLFYTPFRLIGCDYFISNYFSVIPLKIIGFFGLYALCRKFTIDSFFWAVFAAAAFTLSNNMTAHSSRIQLATVALAPLQAILFWNAIDAFLSEKKGRFLGYGVAALLLLGAWCMTCFYMAWFFCFLFFSTLIALTALNPATAVTRSALKLRREIGFLAVVGLIAMAPFVYVYLPKSFETGTRSYADAFSFTVRLPDILQVGEQNLLFGGIYNHFLKSVYPAYAETGEYYNTGFNFVLFALFIAAGLWSRWNAKPILLATLAGTCVTWAFVLRFGSVSPWMFVYYLVPGAKALRVISAYQILLTVPVLVVVVKYLSTRTIDPVIAVVLAAVLLLGELNTEPLGLDRKIELNRVANIPPPPPECRSFFVTAWADQGNIPAAAFVDNLYAHNGSAMLIAQQAGIPTLNGFASFNPPDWNFGNPTSPDYADRVASYIHEHDLSFVCKLDLNKKQWTRGGPDSKG
jgi:hypothetical protein